MKEEMESQIRRAPVRTPSSDLDERILGVLRSHRASLRGRARAWGMAAAFAVVAAGVGFAVGRATAVPPAVAPQAIPVSNNGGRTPSGGVRVIIVDGGDWGYDLRDQARSAQPGFGDVARVEYATWKSNKK